MVAFTSLSEVVDRVNEAAFWGRTLPADERNATAIWLAARQGELGAYEGILFAPAEADLAGDVCTFTGERLHSAVGRRHVLGEEAARALWLLNAPVDEAAAAKERASNAMAAWLARDEARNRAAGRFIAIYCCATCGVSVWRHMTAGGLATVAHWLPVGLAYLHSRRDDAGGWGAFPFWYTISALQEMALPEAEEELRHAARRLERAARQADDGLYSQRRRALAERALGRV